MSDLSGRGERGRELVQMIVSCPILDLEHFPGGFRNDYRSLWWVLIKGFFG